MDKFNKIITSVLVVAFSFFMWGASQTLTALKTIQEQKLGTGIQEQGCTASTTQFALSSNASVQLLATSSARAFAILQLYGSTTPMTASSTVWLQFNDAPATQGNGYALSASSSFPRLELGRKTDHPYTGAIRAIPSEPFVARNTVLNVTECRY